MLLPMLYRVIGQSLSVVAQTTVPDEELYERDIEDWVERQPDVLGERLLVIGRQVQLDEGKDRIDLLAIDTSARLVVIELKRDLVGGSADLQALRYAALVAGWTFEDIRKQAEGHWKTLGANETFAQRIETFCDPGSELNEDQRVILAGRDIRPRLGTMANWLRAHRLDVKVVSISLFRDDDRIYLQPQTIIPAPSDERLTAKVSIGSSDKPWLVNGQAWHLEQRCSPKGREILEGLVELIDRDVPDADGPNWGQKQYVSWRKAGATWLYLHTGSQRAMLDLPGFSEAPHAVAAEVGFAVFETQSDLADKLASGSHIRSLGAGGLRVTVKSPNDVRGATGDALGRLLVRSWRAFADSDASDSVVDAEPEPAEPEPVPVP